MLVFTKNNIITINIRDNSDYIILNNVENDNLSNAIFDFNSKLDFFCLNYENENIHNDIGYDEDNEYIIKYFSFPDYDKEKFKIFHDIKGKINEARFQFINDNSFFFFSSKRLDYFSIEKNKCNLEKKIKIDLDSKTVSIIDYNNEFYCLYDKYKILLLNKENLVTAKKIEIKSHWNINFREIVKISNKIIIEFISEDNKLVVNTYDILSNGIKWEFNNSKTLYEKKMANFIRNNNLILFLKEKEIRFKSRKHTYYKEYNEYFLFKIKVKK